MFHTHQLINKVFILHTLQPYFMILLNHKKIESQIFYKSIHIIPSTFPYPETMKAALELAKKAQEDNITKEAMTTKDKVEELTKNLAKQIENHSNNPTVIFRLDYEYPEDVVHTVVHNIWQDINTIATLYFITFKGNSMVHYENYSLHTGTWPKNNNGSNVNWFAIQYHGRQGHLFTGLSGECNYDSVRKCAF